MKKTFLTRRNALLSSTRFSWGAYALGAAILLLLVRLIAPNFFWHVFAPVFRSADFLSTQSHTFFSSFGDTAKLVLQNEKLQEENTALALENQALLQNTTNIKALLGSTSGLSTTGKSPGPEILARVIARPPENPYDTLTLAAGKNDGVTAGMEVFADGGVPIGIVTSVLNDFSQITLFSSPGMRTAGWVGHANTPLTITGSGAGTFSASLTRSAGISVGDSVYVPGSTGMFPIGKVTHIDSDPSSPAVVLRITPALNPFSISWVVARDMGNTLEGAFSQATSTLP